MRLARMFLAALLLLSTCLAETVNYVYDNAGRLIHVTYASSGKSVFYNYDQAGSLLRRLIATVQPGAAPSIPLAGVVNAASFVGGPVAPGELVTLFGTGIGPPSLVGLIVPRPGFIDNVLSDTLVLFDGMPAPMIYASANQTTAIVPYAVAGKPSTQLQVQFQGRLSPAVTLPVAAAAPALFAFNASGSGGGAILNQDSSLNTASTPADKGSIVVLFGTGEGQTTPAGVDGKLAAGVLPKPAQPVSVTIDGKAAELIYAGAAPTLVAGVVQINVRVPADASSGNLPVVVKVGNAASQNGLTVAVR